MIGFGNPLLDGNPAERPWEAEWAKLARQKQACPQTPWQQVAGRFARRRGVLPMATRDGRPDLDHLRVQTPLHDTADELCAVAKDLKLASDDIVLGANATEATIKKLSDQGKLAQYRVLHFATHGTLAGEIEGTHEPGLILTPPKQQSDLDDGYLSASEVAALKLDADWVILSACNTAAGGAQGAEALSGLARAFFYAGARAMLVSHWSVDSAATGDSGDPAAIDSVRKAIDARLSAEGASSDAANGSLTMYDKGIAASKEARQAHDSLALVGEAHEAMRNRAGSAGAPKKGSAGAHGGAGAQPALGAQTADQIRAHSALGDLYQYGRSLGATESGSQAQALAWVIGANRFMDVNQVPPPAKSLVAEHDHDVAIDATLDRRVAEDDGDFARDVAGLPIDAPPVMDIVAAPLDDVEHGAVQMPVLLAVRTRPVSLDMGFD
jgi:hypothetical protein